MLDYSKSTVEERLSCVGEAISDGTYSLGILGDYLLFVNDRGSTKAQRDEEYPIMTKNRAATIAKREVLCDDFTDDDLISADRSCDNVAKYPISDSDMDMLGMRELSDSISSVRRQISSAEGQRKFDLKRQLIQMYQDRYVIRSSVYGSPLIQRQSFPPHPSDPYGDGHVYMREDGSIASTDTISIFNPRHVRAVMRLYSPLMEQASAAPPDSPIACFMRDFSSLVKRTFASRPLCRDVFALRSLGCSNAEVSAAMARKYHSRHYEQYFSTLWSQRMPRMIAQQAQREWLLHHASEVGVTEWKRCGRCGRLKPAHPMFFPRNSTRDGFYSICKDCR